MTRSTNRLFAIALFAALFAVAPGGCDRDESASAPTPASPAPTGDQPPAPDDGAADESSTADADASPPAAPAKTVATPDVPMPNSAQDNPLKAGFIFFGAAEKPASLAAFYKKELPAKGWKVGREHSGAMPGSTLVNTIQEYTKGDEVVTVAMTEQASVEDVSFVLVMDIPLPPKTTMVVPTGLITIVDVPEAPDQVLAWFAKELPARGWTAGQQTGTGGKPAEFNKGGRKLTVTAGPAGSGKTGSTLQVMHVAYAE